MDQSTDKCALCHWGRNADMPPGELDKLLQIMEDYQGDDIAVQLYLYTRQNE